MKLGEYEISFEVHIWFVAARPLPDHAPSPARPSASVFKILVTSLLKSVGASHIQRLEGRHNPSVEMATLTTAEGTRTPPVLQNFLLSKKWLTLL